MLVKVWLVVGVMIAMAQNAKMEDSAVMKTTITSTSRSRRKRAVFELSDMISCATGCNPLVYKGYGCFCGFLGSGKVVDGIDKCCYKHDWCYDHVDCFDWFTYFIPYKWTCNRGRPFCAKSQKSKCARQLCECDRKFSECLQKFPCPYTKAMCMSPWRYFQNLFMGIGTGSGMHSPHHHNHHHHR